MKELDYFDIKTKRQFNGLWGMPSTVLSLSDSIDNISAKHQELRSAIVMALSERFPKANMHIVSNFLSSNGFNVLFDRDVYDRSIYPNKQVINYDRYILVKNRLYWFSNLNDRKAFMLNKKLKKIGN